MTLSEAVGRMTSQHRRWSIPLVALALVLPVPAAADPVDTKREEAARLEGKLEEQGRRVSVLTERYNRARLDLGGVERSLATAELAFASTGQRLALVRARMVHAATAAYVNGGTTLRLSRLLRARGADVVVRGHYLRVVAGGQVNLLGELKAVREDLAGRRTQLEGERRAVRTRAEVAAKAGGSAADAEAAQRSLLGRAKGELAVLVAAEQGRRAAEGTRPAPVVPAGQGGQGGGLPVGRAPSGQGAVAVAEAEMQLGKPYRYGGGGPDAFDCSGLTAWAWRAAGVTLSHSAYTQWFETTRVPVDELHPGDLVFFGPDVEGIHHNVIYVGDGRMIEASQTGVPVRYANAFRRDLVGAGRPGSSPRRGR